MAIEMLALPMKNGGSFHSYVTVYQRVSPFSIDILLIKFATIDTNYPKKTKLVVISPYHP